VVLPPIHETRYYGHGNRLLHTTLHLHKKIVANHVRKINCVAKYHVAAINKLSKGHLRNIKKTTNKHVGKITTSVSAAMVTMM
jgi:hypothetical protein